LTPDAMDTVMLDAIQAAQEVQDKLYETEKLAERFCGTASRPAVLHLAKGGFQDVKPTPPPNHARSHPRVYQKESEQVSKRILDLKQLLLKRNHLLQEAERLQAEQEAAVRQRAQQAALRREQARKKAQAEEEAQIQVEKARLDAERAQQALQAEKEAQKVAEKEAREAAKLTSKKVATEAFANRNKYITRAKVADRFAKKYKKMVSSFRMMLQMTGETVAAMKLGYSGNSKAGAGKFLSDLKSSDLGGKEWGSQEEVMDIGMHLVAESLLKFGTSNIAPDSIKAGETKFALVYLTLILGVNFADAGTAGFFKIFEEAICALCPYAVPGLRDAIVVQLPQGASREESRAALGYKAKESNADYLARMQAHLGFLAGVYQTPIALLERFGMVPEGSKHPCTQGGIVKCWQWLAMTLNAPASRWTPYLVLAFLAVCGSELSRYSSKQTAKLAKLLASEPYLARAKEEGEFDTSKEDNDADRFATYKQFFASVVNDLNGSFPVPGKDGQDARQLVLDVAANNA